LQIQNNSLKNQINSLKIQTNSLQKAVFLNQFTSVKSIDYFHVCSPPQAVSNVFSLKHLAL